jgi:hypothetical protein
LVKNLDYLAYNPASSPFKRLTRKEKKEDALWKSIIIKALQNNNDFL